MKKIQLTAKEIEILRVLLTEHLNSIGEISCLKKDLCPNKYLWELEKLENKLLPYGEKTK